MIKEYLYTIGKNLGLINDTNKPTIHVKPENPEREKLKKEEKLKNLIRNLLF